MDKPPVPSNRGNQNLENFVLDKTVGAASSDSQSQDRRASTSSFDRTWTFSTAVNAASESGATAATRATAVVDRAPTFSEAIASEAATPTKQQNIPYNTKSLTSTLPNFSRKYSNPYAPVYSNPYPTKYISPHQPVSSRPRASSSTPLEHEAWWKNDKNSRRKITESRPDRDFTLNSTQANPNLTTSNSNSTPHVNGTTENNFSKSTEVNRSIECKNPPLLPPGTVSARAKLSDATLKGLGFTSDDPDPCGDADPSGNVNDSGDLEIINGSNEVEDIDKMVGKKSGKALQLEEGLERTDNGLKFTSFPEVPMINQKNYYTEYMKRDDQILTTRLQTEATRDKMIKNAKDRDRALARTGNTDVPVPAADVMDLDDDEGALADERDHTKTIIIHVGSQNLRIGLASDALPKTIPMCCAVPMPQPECEVKEPLPRRQQATGPPEEQWGEEWAKKYQKQCNDLKIDMRANKRKVLPNSKELVVNYNRRTPPEKISEHNDPVRIEWTDVSAGEVITGHEAQRIPDDSKPAYRIYWPIQNGRLNEKDFSSREQMKNCIDSILMDAMMKEKYMTKRSQLKEFSCVYIIPDLYDKKYVELVADSLLTTFGFMRIAFIQESLAASFGAGYTSNCIVDIGAQKTSICCVEDGMCVDDSRVNVKYGGYDVTETFIKMMLFDYFPYSDINLMRRYDFLLAEELKQKFCTMNQAEISVQLYNFHLRAPGEYTRKYNFKTYDEVILAPMGMFDPSIFDNSDKLAGRRKLIDRSYNVYDPDAPDDPISAAQCDILAKIKPSLAAPIRPQVSNGEVSTPMREKPQPFNLSRFDSEANGTPGTSTANSPAPEGANTPNPEKMNGYTGSPAPAFQFSAGFDKGTPNPDAPRSVLSLAIERDTVLPLTPLDAAIVTSIMFASKNDEKKLRDFMGGIMVIGGGAKTPGFLSYLEDRLKKLRPDLADRVMVGTSPREMDGQVVTWKGGQVYSKLSHAQESFIGGAEWERLGCRVIHNKAAWFY